jgi:thiol-disulfide isomerase/thioredoxin
MRCPRSVVQPLILSFVILSATCALAGPQARERAPRFNAKTMAGEIFTNQSTKGKVVLLEFWTTWCPYCSTEAPFVDKLHKEFGDKGLLVLTINVGESKKTVKKYLEQEYPIYVVIDKDGNIAATQHGAAGEEALRDMVAIAGIGTKEDAESK